MTTRVTLPARPPAIPARPALGFARLVRVPLRTGWARARPILLALLPVLLLACALGLAAGAWRISRDTATIHALSEGRDIAVSAEAAPSLVLARVLHLARRGATEAIEPLVEALDTRGAVDAASRARYALANAHLRQAFDHLERGDLDPAGPRITLARQAYRRALQGRPTFWDAKFNLDVASRLLRDFPEFDRKSGDALAAEPKKIWTDIPGQPRGEP
ncbi:MxaK protein [Methylobacterium sp. Leaf113]|uniref:MxaK protein n=1 Tax=Methylobacterium sp. Leaf113 TaxID=1736259 RepID=UPI000AE07270|nr:MxaK protein [Methylobacterium sp. Leaf113]